MFKIYKVDVENIIGCKMKSLICFYWDIGFGTDQLPDLPTSFNLMRHPYVLVWRCGSVLRMGKPTDVMPCYYMIYIYINLPRVLLFFFFFEMS
jgi:hypothetical protein